MMVTSSTRADTRATGVSGSLTAPVPVLLAITFGLVVLFCVGFLQTPAAHNGAHDTRHANGFPCH